MNPELTKSYKRLKSLQKSIVKAQEEIEQLQFSCQHLEGYVAVDAWCPSEGTQYLICDCMICEKRWLVYNTDPAWEYWFDICYNPNPPQL